MSRFIGVYYLDEGSRVLELGAQLLFLLVCFYFCNQNPPSPRCLVEAGGRVFVLLSRYHENSKCFLDVSGGLAILIEPGTRAVRHVTTTGLGWE